jgi:pyridoxamine 5'-phosphate oxidase
MPPPGPFDQASVAAGDQCLPEPLPADPFPLFESWLNDAEARRTQPNPNSFCLATIDPDGRPSARILLCKGIDQAAGAIEFFTNYQSRKGMALDANPRAAACFHWDVLDRQARIEGAVVRVPATRSDEYFASRPWESRIGAWASDQGKPLASRAELAEKVRATMRRFGLERPPGPGQAVSIPRPPHWGGFRLIADRVELWVSGAGRVHDRAAWTRRSDGTWDRTRLQP